QVNCLTSGQFAAIALRIGHLAAKQFACARFPQKKGSSVITLAVWTDLRHHYLTHKSIIGSCLNCEVHSTLLPNGGWLQGPVQAPRCTVCSLSREGIRRLHRSRDRDA